MRKTLPFWVVIVVCMAALVASSILLVDYVRPAPVFCDTEGGCGIVKRTVFAYPLGIPTPLLGIAGFLAIGLAQLLPGRRARIAQAMLAAFGAIVAAGLLAVQASMKTLCPFCAVADVSALVLVALSVARALRGWDPPVRRAHLASGVAAILVAVVAPILVGLNKKAIPTSIPQVIADEMRLTPRNKVTVVDFVDFECPFCRMTHAELAPLLAERKDHVRVARKHVPLRMHAHAMDAARAACCGEKLGKGEEMTEALFTAPPDELTPEGCEALALKNGLDVGRFRDCLKDPSIDARIRADMDAFRAAHGHGLPTIYIEGTKLEGAQDREVLKETLDGAIKAL
jgi:protein-disulfide isomerase